MLDPGSIESTSRMQEFQSYNVFAFMLHSWKHSPRCRTEAANGVPFHQQTCMACDDRDDSNFWLYRES